MATFPGPGASKKAVRVALITVALAGTLFAGRAEWTRVGPEGGTVAALAADPQNPSTVYAATCAGVFKTVDGGANWSAVNSGLPGIQCQTGPGILAVDPQNTGTVYVSTGNQIFKTTHGGTSWNAISTPKVTGILRVLLIAPSNPNTLYASDGPEIFKSTDGGATWAQTGSGTGLPLALDPQHQDTLYANRSGGLFKSTDGGTSWNPAHSGLPAVQAEPAYGVGVLAVDPQNPDTLYASAGWGQIFKSTDGGANWSLASFGLPSAPAPSAGNNSVVFLAINPQNPAVIYALIRQSSFGGPGHFLMATSTDGATSWTLASDPLLATSLYTIAPDPRDGGTLYLGTSNGVLRTADAGGHWSLANGGLRAAGIQSIVIDSQTPGSLVAVTNPAADGAARLFKSTNGGNSWSLLNGLVTDDGVPVGLAADPQHPGTLYALETLRGALFQSEDSGGSWAKIWSTPSGAEIGPLAIHPQNPNVMYLGLTTCTGSCYDRIAKSTDAGHTWTESQVALKGMGCCSMISSVAADPQNPGIVYAGTLDGDGGGSGFWKSTDGGVSWINLGTGDVYAIAIDPRNPATIYAAWNGSLAKSTDGGQTWNFGLGPSSGALVIDPQNSATIYGLAGDELFRSTDAGASWAEVSGSGLSGFVHSLTIDPQQPRTLYAATDRGLFAIRLDAQKYPVRR